MAKKVGLSTAELLLQFYEDEIKRLKKLLKQKKGK